MEIRDRQISPHTDSASFRMSFVDTDVKRLLVNTYSKMFYIVGDKSEETFTREDLLTILQGLSQDLSSTVGGKYCRDLSEWGLNLAIRRGYITQVAPGMNLFRLSGKIVTESINKARKREGCYF